MFTLLIFQYLLQKHLEHIQGKPLPGFVLETVLAVRIAFEGGKEYQ
jgi:hypothetical protein